MSIIDIKNNEKLKQKLKLKQKAMIIFVYFLF
jgi:hypothetical protein